MRVLIEETVVRAVPNLPQNNLQTAAVMDAIYAVLPKIRNLRRSRKALQEPSAD